MQSYLRLFLCYFIKILGYRDYKKGHETDKKLEKERLVEMPFTENVDKFKSFLSQIKAYGGEDQCEVFKI